MSQPIQKTEAKTETKTETQTETQTYIRFTIDERIEHILLIASFTILCLTGLPQKYAGAPWAEAIIAALGGIETVRIIHRFTATVFILEIVYHVVSLGYKLIVRRMKMSMIPVGKDVLDALQAFLYNLGIARSRPKAGHFSFEEKLEYWAMIWGSVIMILTGLMMWNPIATTSSLPGEVIPAAKAAHGSEALLAFLGILIWHFYNVHLRHFNTSMFTGEMSRQEIEEEHPLELKDLDAGEPPVDEAAVARRRRVYIPIVSVLTVVLLVGIYKLLTFETTSVATAPPVETVEVYVPQTPTPIPTAPPLPTAVAQTSGGAAALTWDGQVGSLFQQRCGACHGSSGGLSVKSYADLMKGGAKGAVVIPGSADTSPLVVIQAGSHPGKFSPSELELVKEWINKNAPEK